MPGFLGMRKIKNTFWLSGITRSITVWLSQVLQDQTQSGFPNTIRSNTVWLSKYRKIEHSLMFFQVSPQDQTQSESSSITQDQPVWLSSITGSNTFWHTRSRKIKHSLGFQVSQNQALSGFRIRRLNIVWLPGITGSNKAWISQVLQDQTQSVWLSRYL
jgi:hypothetical protein